MAKKNKTKNDAQPMLLGLEEAIDSDAERALNQADLNTAVYDKMIKGMTDSLVKMDDRLTQAILCCDFCVVDMSSYSGVLEQAQEHILSAAKLISGVDYAIRRALDAEKEADKIRQRRERIAAEDAERARIDRLFCACREDPELYYTLSDDDQEALQEYVGSLYYVFDRARERHANDDDDDADTPQQTPKERKVLTPEQEAALKEAMMLPCILDQINFVN